MDKGTFTIQWMNCERRTTKCSIPDHLLTASHQIQPDAVFLVIYCRLVYFNKVMKKRLLCAAEAVAIRLFVPIRCRQNYLNLLHILHGHIVDMYIYQGYIEARMNTYFYLLFFPHRMLVTANTINNLVVTVMNV